MQHNQHGEHNSDENHYLRLAVMIVLSFISMYVLMYAMVNTLGDVYNSLNQVYMAGLMTAPMVVIEVLLMSGMYKNKKLNALLDRWELRGRHRVLPLHQAADRDLGSPVLAVDDPASLGGDPDVRGGVSSGSEDSRTLQNHHDGPAAGDRPDAGNPGGPEPRSVEAARRSVVIHEARVVHVPGAVPDRRLRSHKLRCDGGSRRAGRPVAVSTGVALVGTATRRHRCRPCRRDRRPRRREAAVDG